MAPTIRMKIDSTIAKTGRSMAKWPMPMSVPAHGGLLGRAWRGHRRDGLAGAHALEPVDDDLVGYGNAGAYDPQPIDDRPELDLAGGGDIVVAHHIDEAPRLVGADRLVGQQQGVVLGLAQKLDTGEHAGCVD